MMKKISIIILSLIICLFLNSCLEESIDVNEIKDGIEIIYSGDDSINSIKESLILPTLVKDTRVNWASSNENVISMRGVVVRTSIDEQITLTASFVVNNNTYNKVFLCTVLKKDEEIIIDNIAPLLRYSDTTFMVVNINQGDNINIYEGLIGIDNIDGNISDKIVCTNIDDFSKEIPGVYILTFVVIDKAGNMSDSLNKTINVKRHLSIINDYDIYNGVITGEAKKPTSTTAFPGAWYYKLYSSKDYWLGIEGTITLPDFEIRRYNNEIFDETLPVDSTIKNLDNPSIYLGGNAGSESDVGLSLGSALLKNNTISTGSLVFRPFWRYITSSEYDLGGYDLTNGRRYAVSSSSTGTLKNCQANWYYGDTEYYYLPGDKLRIIVYSPEPNYLQLQISVISKSSNSFSINLRNSNNWKDPSDFVSPIFRAPGYGVASTKAEYKRVNAIDQSGNEGKPAIKTNSNVKIAVWDSTYLYRLINGVIYKVPLNKNRGEEIFGPSKSSIISSQVDEISGGGTVIIIPTKP
jgi:hypothetical protein